MKKLSIYLILITIIFYSCNSEEIKRLDLLKTGTSINGYNIAILEFDSCEYLISGSGYSQMITHKGNCKFCKERNKK